MPTAVITSIDNTSSVINITLEKADFQQKYEKELKNTKQRAQMKGFRPGTAPLSIVKKLYGKQLLSDILQEQLNEELQNTIERENLNVLGSPVSLTEKMDLNADQPADSYTYSFKIGHYNFELEGLDNSTTLNCHTLADSTSLAEEQFASIAKKSVRPVDVTDEIIEGDIFYIDSKELNEDGSVREGGYETTFVVYSKSMKMRASLSAQIMGKLKVDDQITFNARDLDEFETAKTIDEVETNYRRYILNLESSDDRQVNNNFTGTIKSVLRTTEPVLDEVFYERNFPEGITTKEQAIEMMKENLALDFDNQLAVFNRRKAKIALIEANQFDIPEEMMITWMKKNDPRLTDEVVAEQRPKLMNMIRWELIMGNIAQNAGVGVEKREIEQYFAQAIKGHYGGYDIPDEYLKPMIKRMMDDKTQVDDASREIVDGKTLDFAVSQMSINSIPSTQEDLEASLKADLEHEQLLLRVTYA